MQTSKPPEVYKGGPGITTKQINVLFRAFVRDDMAASAADQAKVNRNTAELWYRYWREQIYRALRRAPRLFGTIEMDQKGFGGPGRKKMQIELKRLAKKVSYQEYQKLSKGIRERHKTQVFGILQRGGDVYVHIIKRADKATLMPIIRLVVEQGSVIHTDKWRSFSDLGIDGYTHESVNHSIEYVDKKGIHTNGIESFWSFAQRRLAKFNGIQRHVFPLHIKECEFRYNHRDMGKALKLLLQEDD